MLTYLLNFFCMYFPRPLINTGMAIIFFWFQFQFQFFTLKTENSDKTKKVGRSTVTWTWQTLVCKKYFFPRKVFSTKHTVLIFWQLGGVPRTGGSRPIRTGFAAESGQNDEYWTFSPKIDFQLLYHNFLETPGVPVPVLYSQTLKIATR